MNIKINNKKNIFPIGIYTIWICFVLYFLFFRINLFSEKTPCGAGTAIVGLALFTIIFSLLALLVIAIINLFSKQKYYTDYEYISIPFIILVLIFFIINIF